MGIQLIGIRHSNGIQQAVFIDWDRDNKRVFRFQGVPPRSWGTPTVHKSLTAAEVIEHFEAWSELEEAGELVVTHRDSMFETYRNGIAGMAAEESAKVKAPTIAEAMDYVRAHFATHDYGHTVALAGSIAPGRDSSGPLAGSRDVLVLVDDDPRPSRFTVWFEPREDGSTFLYGEW